MEEPSEELSKEECLEEPLEEFFRELMDCFLTVPLLLIELVLVMKPLAGGAAHHWLLLR